MDNTAELSCGRITETEHAIEGIRADMKTLRRRTDEIEEGHKATTNKIVQEKRQIKLPRQLAPAKLAGTAGKGQL